MARTIISYRNIVSTNLYLRDLDDTTCTVGSIKELSERNNFDDIVSSRDLYELIESDQALIVIDGQELKKRKSLEFLDLYRNVVNGDVHSGINVIDIDDCIEIKEDKEMIVSAMAINGILIINGILTVI